MCLLVVRNHECTKVVTLGEVHRSGKLYFQSVGCGIAQAVWLLVFPTWLFRIVSFCATLKV